MFGVDIGGAESSTDPDVVPPLTGSSPVLPLTTSRRNRNGYVEHEDQISRSQNASPILQEQMLQLQMAPKRLFSGPTPGTSTSTLASFTHSHRSTTSDCGSEYTKSLDDIAGAAHPRFESKTEEGNIKLCIPNLSQLRQKVNTSYNYIANLPWRLAAKTECSKRTSQIKYFSVYIDCNPESESTLWSCDAVVEFRLVGANQKHFSRQFNNKFNFNSNNWGFPSFMEWSEIVNPEKGYIRNDRVTVEARITVQKVVGVRKNPCFDFLAPQPNVCDVAIVIDGKKLHVSKTYLALYSPVFHAMFFSKFSERNKTEIPIEDVVIEEFIELLQVVYPSHKAVSSDNVEYLLELGDKFEIQFVIDECEKFLMNTNDIQTVTKLVWADQYCLAQLQDNCVRTFKTVEDIKMLKNTEEYKNLSDTTKAALLEKIFKILKD